MGVHSLVIWVVLDKICTACLTSFNLCWLCQACLGLSWRQNLHLTWMADQLAICYGLVNAQEPATLTSLVLQAILSATRASFTAMKKRLGSRASAGFLYVERPLFDVSVQLSVPRVVMVPSLEDIQTAINTAGKKVSLAGSCAALQRGFVPPAAAVP